MFTLNCKGRLLAIDKPIIMGIINSTPDSFYSGSREQNVGQAVAMAEKMYLEGAAIIDIGGQSTRPGSARIDAEEELRRVIPVIEGISQKLPELIISIDTYFSKVVKEAVAAGASIVNDISAGSLDPGMIPEVAALKVPYVLMHMQGNPDNMHLSADYKNVTTDVLDFFIQKMTAIRSQGVNDIIIDPGFGFGKTIAHNFELLKNLSAFQILKLPLLLGISRKSTIYKTLGIEIEQALNGTTVLHTIGLMKGANILRVHDVKEAREAIVLCEACLGEN